MNDIDPEVLRAILEGGAESGQLDPEIEAIKEMIAQLRERGGPAQGRTVRGGIYVKSNPLEHLASAGSNIMGGMKQREMADLQKQQAGIRGTQNRSVLDALLNRGGASTQGPSSADWPTFTGGNY